MSGSHPLIRAMAATCLMLHRTDRTVLLINNLNPSDSLYSKSILPFSFWGFPFLQHEVSNYLLLFYLLLFDYSKTGKTPNMSDILQHNQIQIEPSKERHYTLVDKVTTPNFIDS
jgi:hypothetical protein